MRVRIAAAAAYVVMMALGWRWPILGTLLVGLLAATVLAGRRRKWCSSYCPRGGFLDLVMARLSPRRPIPRFLTDRRTWAVALVLFLGAFGLNLRAAWNAHPGDLLVLGTAMWRMCLLSSLIALPLALFLNHRTWCAFCPVGNLLRRG
jgi:polyferredoxin